MPVGSDIGKLLAEAYPDRIANQIEKHGTRFKLANGRVSKLPEHDSLIREAWLVIAQIDSGTGEGKIFMAAPLSEDDLKHLAVEKESITWDPERGIQGSVDKRIGNLILSSRPIVNISAAHRTQILVNALQAEGMKLLQWGVEHRNWQARVMSLRKWRPEEGWPDVSDENLIATAEEWLTPFLNEVYKPSDFHRLNINQIISTLLPWELANKLDKLAPVSIIVPSGSMIRINYTMTGETPILEVRLQEMFGLLETPTVNEGRTKLMLHLLSPGYKPVQVTQDLKSFWQTAYHDVRKELRMRYPKHSWPEDPWTAQAVRGVKKKN
jgi:ATP-dependent helicase HrpB